MSNLVTDDVLIAAALANPDADAKTLAEMLGVHPTTYLRRRHEPGVSARIDAELNRQRFARPTTAAAETMLASIETLVRVRDDRTSRDRTSRDRMTAAKLLIEIAIRLDDRQRELDRLARLESYFTTEDNP